MQFTQEQLKATESIDGNLQIVACAGSGKTQVVSQRIINILKSGNATPRNIVAFTYTDKAAAELKHRILTLAAEQLGGITGLAELYIGTIHSWCMHYLKEYRFGLQKFEVLNEVRLKLFVDQRNQKIGMAELGLSRFTDTGLFLQLMNVARECEIAQGETLPQEIAAVVQKYEQALEKHAYFDFTMMLTRFLREITSNSDIQKRIAQDIKHVIVDEYQDVNFIQESIISQLHDLGAKLCVVGDDDQTIYQWRGSSIANILHFSQKYPNVKQVTLAENFRSSKAVIDLAKTAIAKIPDGHRLPKEMTQGGHQEYEMGDLLIENFSSLQEEEEFIIRTINAVRGTTFQDRANGESRGIDYGDICILLRKWKVAKRLAEAMRHAGIPYIVTGVSELFEQPEVEACVGIYKLIAKEISQQDLFGMWKALTPKLDDNKLQQAIGAVGKIKPDNDEWHEYFNLQEIFQKFRETAAITESLFQGNADQGLSRAEVVFYNMGMFSQVIEDFEAIHFRDRQEDKLRSLLGFLHYSAGGYYPEGWLTNSFASPNAVTITSIYQAKGLEWPVVFLPNMNKNYFPGKKHGGKNIWSILDRSVIHDQARLEGSLEDELRLLYVAITRSKKFFFVSRAPGESRLDKKPSEFLNHMRGTNYIFSDPNSHLNFAKRIKADFSQEKKLGNIILNFSLLEAFFKCPYSFKYYTLYGFKEPLTPRIGYGKSIHDALMEIHRRAMDGDTPSSDELTDVLKRHAHFPYAIPDVRDQMEEKAQSAVGDYYKKYKEEFNNIEYAEKDIQLDLGDGILVNGRMDLIKRKELNGKIMTYIVDFKSDYGESKHSVSVKQLLLYALGYRELTGESADFLQIYDFKESQEHNHRLMSEQLDSITLEIKHAADKIRANDFSTSCGNPKCPCRFSH